MEYKIEVIMAPHYHDSPAKPYFWRIASFGNEDWCTHTAGWAATPEEAWKEANAFYLKYIGVEE